MKTISALVLVALFAVGCGSSATTAPTPPAPATTPSTFTLSGTVSSTTGAGISGATVRIVDGGNAGKSTTTTGAGTYSFIGLSVSGMTVNASAPYYSAAAKGVTLTSSQNVDFQLAPIPLFTMAGKGDNVFTIPSTVTKVRVTGHFVDAGSNSNFIVRLNGASFINEILRQSDYDGILQTPGGGTIAITSSGSIAWTFTEVR